MDGLDGLLANFQDMIDDIDDDVNEILRNNAIEGVGFAQKNARDVMNKGYWTGNLARMIDYAETGKLKYTVTSNAHYSGFLEYGTRFMSAAPFIFPTYQTLRKNVVADLNRLLND